MKEEVEPTIQTTLKLKVKIAGVGHYLPKRIVYNDELEDMLGIERGYIDSTTAGPYFDYCC